ncbi:hypothetical protein [Yoonia sp. SS1-5]|uniref:TfoX N-terminal domain-containing protein n=1 Tax=Yoonia rhodophyticola TaxID=3137370 RepID=A0AAN0MFS1_9RHOB
MDRDAVVAIYDRLIAGHAGLVRKGKATAYTALNGNMFSFVGPDGQMCIRLSKVEIADYGRDYPNDPVIRYNSVMNGYVAVPDALLDDEGALTGWFAKSVAFARTLKPKPTKK